MKKIGCWLAVAVMLFGCCACGGAQTDLVGDWVLVDGNSPFGAVLRFEEGGVFLFAPSLDSIHSASGIDASLAAMQQYYTITYRVKNRTTIELTVAVLSTTVKMDVAYALELEELLFDGAMYRRIS